MCSFGMERIIEVSEYNFLFTLRFGLGLKGGLATGGAPERHSI